MKKNTYMHFEEESIILTGSAVITHDVTTGTGCCFVGFNWIIDFLNWPIGHSVT